MPSEELKQLREILSNLASLLVMSGCSSKDLAREFTIVCEKLSSGDLSGSGFESSKIDHAHIISHWYRDAGYLDATGKPLKLAFSGSGRTLEGLITGVLPGVPPRQVLESLLELGAVKESHGLYEPTSLGVDFGSNRDHLAYWSRKALHGVLQNMVHNYTRSAQDHHMALAAINPRFPVKELRAFHSRIGRRAKRFLSDVDAGMQRLEVSGGQGETTELGVIVLAFANPTGSGVNGDPPTPEITGAAD